MTKVEQLRQDILRVAVKNNKGHIAPSLSCLDILTVLNYENYFEKDLLVLSKGHGCYGLYAIWAEKGKIAPQDWENFNLSGCLEGFGSLGHGLPIATGLAYGYGLQGKHRHITCIVGDGELQEGSNWEALSFIKHHDLKNITIIVDNNGLQAMDKVDNILSHNLVDRFKGWGFKPEVCDGHNYMELLAILRLKPRVVIANTIKGKGVDYMEGVAKWHFRVPEKDYWDGE